MELHLSQVINLESICLMLKNKLSITYKEMADVMGCEPKTLERWRKGLNKYKTLSDMQYKPLFYLIETHGCTDNNDFVKILISWFPELKEYQDKEKIKSIIKDCLDYNINVVKKSSVNGLNKNENTVSCSKDFLELCLKKEKSIDNICMAFHSGWDWFKDKEKHLLLEQLNELKITLRVIVNHKDAIERIAESMIDPKQEKYYLGFNEGIIQWGKSICFLDHFNFRVSDYPILRKVYIVNYKDGTSEALIRDYAYDFAKDYDFANVHLTDNDFLLKVFQKEFEFLWNNAISYSNWVKFCPKQEEILSSDEYVLLYLSQTKELESPNDIDKAFIISALQVTDNNRVRLDVNIADRLTSNLQFNNPEYTYKGSIKMTRNNIFFTLFDESASEQVSISIVRPLHENKRFLGIMTGLSPQAKPVALKCACIHRSILSKINIQLLRQILCNNNKEWKESIMAIEERDSNLFYSNRILLDDNLR